MFFCTDPGKTSLSNNAQQPYAATLYQLYTGALFGRSNLEEAFSAFTQPLYWDPQSTTFEADLLAT